MSTPKSLDTLPDYPQNPYEVSPSIPDVIPLEMREILEKNKILQHNPVLVTIRLVNAWNKRTG